VHFIGIGGIGMSGIAELLANLGFAVSGSDEKRSDVTDRLETLGIRIAVGHAAGQVGDADVVVVSSAVRPTNPEVVEAGRRQIPVIPRAEMLAELMRLRFAIAVAGAHGKTTTTSMIALVLERAGLDPTAVIGGRLSAFGSNARLGQGEHLVAEADESDRSFLKLFPTIAVITNIDREHLENYGGFDDLLQAFVDFANKVPFYGGVVACLDDANLAGVLPRMTRRMTTYGLESDADLIATDVELGPLTVTATVQRRERRTRAPVSADGAAPTGSHATLGTLSLAVPGRHMPVKRVVAGIQLAVRKPPVQRRVRGVQGLPHPRRELLGGQGLRLDQELAELRAPAVALENRQELAPRDDLLRDEDVAEQHVGLRLALHAERLLHLGVGREPLGDEKVAEPQNGRLAARSAVPDGQ